MRVRFEDSIRVSFRHRGRVHPMHGSIAGKRTEHENFDNS